MKRRNLFLLVAALLLAGAAAFLFLRRSPGAMGRDPILAALEQDTSSPPPPKRVRTAAAPDSALLPQLVRDSNWMVRLTATDAVVQNQSLPEPRRAELVLDALAQEVITPASGRPLAGSYLPLTGVFRLRYVHMLENLGSAAADPARAAMQRESGLRREWATVALGAAGARDAIPALRQLLRSSAQPDVRMSAAYFLGRLRDSSAVADLKAALSDTATARVLADDTGEKEHVLFPVREQAAGALMALGLKVERNGNTFTAN
jgi:HEAT repeat protein